jgi:hypothetical protein
MALLVFLSIVMLLGFVSGAVMFVQGCAFDERSDDDNEAEPSERGRHQGLFASAERG